MRSFSAFYHFWTHLICKMILSSSKNLVTLERSKSSLLPRKIPPPFILKSHTPRAQGLVINNILYFFLQNFQKHHRVRIMERGILMVLISLNDPCHLFFFFFSLKSYILFLFLFFLTNTYNWLHIIVKVTNYAHSP